MQGVPIASLWVSCSDTDADVFVYLEDEGPSGSIGYVTEGVLRASLFVSFFSLSSSLEIYSCLLIGGLSVFSPSLPHKNTLPLSFSPSLYINE